MLKLSDAGREQAVGRVAYGFLMLYVVLPVSRCALCPIQMWRRCAIGILFPAIRASPAFSHMFFFNLDYH